MKYQRLNANTCIVAAILFSGHPYIGKGKNVIVTTMALEVCSASCRDYRNRQQRLWSQAAREHCQWPYTTVQLVVASKRESEERFSDVKHTFINHVKRHNYWACTQNTLNQCNSYDVSHVNNVCVTSLNTLIQQNGRLKTALLQERVSFATVLTPSDAMQALR